MWEEEKVEQTEVGHPREGLVSSAKDLKGECVLRSGSRQQAGMTCAWCLSEDGFHPLRGWFYLDEEEETFCRQKI